MHTKKEICEIDNTINWKNVISKHKNIGIL